MTLNYDLDLGFSRSYFEIAISDLEVLIDIEYLDIEVFPGTCMKLLREGFCTVMNNRGLRQEPW